MLRIARGLAKTLGYAAYAGGLFLVFAASSYLAFSLFVRSGVTSAPDLAGLPLEEARAVLLDQGFEMRLSDDARYDAAIAADHVLEQDPAPGDLVKRGSTLTVTPSLGPLQISVPDLRGQGAQSAQVLLTAASLTLGRTVRVFAAGAEPGTVVAQEPQAGMTAPPTSPVHVAVATASSVGSYVMPDLVYRQLETVRGFFERRGFTLTSVKTEAYDGIPAGVVLRQTPPAGYPLDRRTGISLVVAGSP